jgi:hypothetical protein
MTDRRRLDCAVMWVEQGRRATMQRMGIKEAEKERPRHRRIEGNGHAGCVQRQGRRRRSPAKKYLRSGGLFNWLSTQRRWKGHKPRRKKPPPPRNAAGDPNQPGSQTQGGNKTTQNAAGIHVAPFPRLCAHCRLDRRRKAPVEVPPKPAGPSPQPPLTDPQSLLRSLPLPPRPRSRLRRRRW